MRWVILVSAWLLVIPSLRSEVVDRMAAAVADEPITLSDLEWLIQYRELEVPDDPDEKRNFYLALLDQVIDQKLIAAEAEQTPVLDITADKIAAQTELYRSRFSSEEAFNQRLAEMEMSSYEFARLIRRQLAVNEFVELRFKPFIIVLPTEIEAYYQEQFVPQLRELNQPVPDLEVVDESIRQILTEEKTNQELDRWLRTARRRARIINLLFREDPQAPNLPPAVQQNNGVQRVPSIPKSR
jgi:hypothetical protein